MRCQSKRVKVSKGELSVSSETRNNSPVVSLVASVYMAS